MTTKLERHASELAALAHPARLRALRFVVQSGASGASAGEIQAHVGLPASTLSHHLKRLVMGGLLTVRNVGTSHVYAAEYAALRRLTDYLWEDCCKEGRAVRACC